MKVEIKVPAMGESITEATIGTIIKASGSTVKADDEIIELETDKVNQVLYAPQAGVVTFQVKPDQVVKIGEVIGYIDTEAQAATQPASTGPAPEAKVEAAKPAASIPQTEKPFLDPTPKVPPVAKEPITPLPPQNPALSPPGSATADVRQTKEKYVEELKTPAEPKPAEAGAASAVSSPAPKAQPVAGGTPERPVTRTKLSKIRKVIAQRLVEAQQTTAMLTTFNEVDMSTVMELREKYKEPFLKEHGVKLGFMSFFVKAVVTALKEVPQINAFIDGEDLVQRQYIDVGVAVGTDRGLFVPVVRGCDKLSFAEIEKGIEEFAKKAREGKLMADDLQGGGFTITNGGVYGSLLSTPILNPPQSGILGMHKIQKRPVVVNDQIVIRPMMYLALSYDHRVVDGKEAVTFLVHVKDYLEDPSRLLLEV